MKPRAGHMIEHLVASRQGVVDLTRLWLWQSSLLDGLLGWSIPIHGRSMTRSCALQQIRYGWQSQSVSAS